MQSIYGWSTLQYQAWARGNLTVGGSDQTLLHSFTDGMLELRVDGKEGILGGLLLILQSPNCPTSNLGPACDLSSTHP